LKNDSQWFSVKTVNYLFFIQDYFKNIDLINDKITEQGLWDIGSIIKDDLSKLSFFVEIEIYKFYNEISETLNVTVDKHDSRFTSSEFNSLFEETNYFKNEKMINQIVESNKIKPN
jgi:hypothetical protein